MVLASLAEAGAKYQEQNKVPVSLRIDFPLLILVQTAEHAANMSAAHQCQFKIEAVAPSLEGRWTRVGSDI